MWVRYLKSNQILNFTRYNFVSLKVYFRQKFNFIQREFSDLNVLQKN